MAKTEISSGFISFFNEARNTVRNVETLSVLYEMSITLKDEEKRKLLIKPKIVLIAAIAEAVLWDFAQKPRAQHVEIQRFLEPATVESMLKNETDEFSKLINKFKGNNLLNIKGTVIYDDLDELRLLRNRVHIQNTNRIFEEYEVDAFTYERLKRAEKTLEYLLKRMLELYDRKMTMSYVDDFVLPWAAHFS